MINLHTKFEVSYLFTHYEDVEIVEFGVV